MQDQESQRVAAVVVPHFVGLQFMQGREISAGNESNDRAARGSRSVIALGKSGMGEGRSSLL